MPEHEAQGTEEKDLLTTDSASMNPAFNQRDSPRNCFIAQSFSLDYWRGQPGLITVLGVPRLLKATGLFVIVRTRETRARRGAACGWESLKNGEKSGETLSMGYTRY